MSAKLHRTEKVLRLIREQLADDPHNTLLLTACEIVAHFEHRVISARVKQGVAEARLRGKRIGRPTRLTPEVEIRVRELLSRGVGVQKIGGMFGIGTPTVQKIKKRMKEETA